MSASKELFLSTEHLLQNVRLQYIFTVPKNIRNGENGSFFHV
jgi:hypothetical protein